MSTTQVSTARAIQLARLAVDVLDDLDNELRRDGEHIERPARKARKQVGILRRNLELDHPELAARLERPDAHAAEKAATETRYAAVKKGPRWAGAR